MVKDIHPFVEKPNHENFGSRYPVENEVFCYPNSPKVRGWLVQRAAPQWINRQSHGGRPEFGNVVVRLLLAPSAISKCPDVVEVALSGTRQP
jgi:hypothetical protein